MVLFGQGVLKIFTSFDSKRMLLLLYSLTLVYFRLLHGRFTSSSNSTLVYGFLPRLSIFSSLFHRIWPARYEDICKFHFIAYGFIVTVYCTIWLYFQSIRRKYTSYTDILYTVRFLRQLSIYLSWFRANWSRTNRFIINFLFYCDLPVYATRYFMLWPSLDYSLLLILLE